MKKSTITGKPERHRQQTGHLIILAASPASTMPKARCPGFTAGVAAMASH